MSKLNTSSGLGCLFWTWRILPFFMLLACIDLLFNLITTQPTEISKIHHYKKYSLYYTEVCVNDNEFCSAYSQHLDWHTGETAYTYQYINFADLPLLLLPSEVTWESYKFIRKEIWVSIPYVKIGWSLFILMIGLLILKLRRGRSANDYHKKANTFTKNIE